MYSFTWDDCLGHEWDDSDPNILDTMFSSFQDVKCIHCGVPGQRNNSDQSVYYPAT